jgi:hypothetical protein
MVLCLDYSVLALNHSRNILFQTMVINSDVLFVPNYLGSNALTSKVCASSAVLQLNKGTQK